jgi:hypothetical protein
MSKTKQDYLNELVLIAFRMDEKANRQHERTKKIQRMASLAKQGLKDTEEFKRLEMECRQPTVTDFGNEMNDLQRVVKQLKRYKWE